MRAGAIAVVACGCNAVFGLHQTELKDAPPDAVGCSGKAFDGPFPLASPSNGDDPVGTPDGLELWFDHTTSTHQQVFVARRATPDGVFDTGTVAPFADPSSIGYDPTLTGDGLRLLFVSTRAGGATAWEVTRAALTDPFPVLAAERASLGDPIDSISISFDGMTAYFSANKRLYASTRPRLDDSFGAPVDLGLAGENPAISPDELELFYDTGGVTGDIVRSVRTSAGGTFGPPEPVLTGAFEPGLTPDSRTLYVVETSSSVLMYMTRTCP